MHNSFFLTILFSIIFLNQSINSDETINIDKMTPKEAYQKIDQFINGIFWSTSKVIFTNIKSDANVLPGSDIIRLRLSDSTLNRFGDTLYSDMWLPGGEKIHDNLSNVDKNHIVKSFLFHDIKITTYQNEIISFVCFTDKYEIEPGVKVGMKINDVVKMFDIPNLKDNESGVIRIDLIGSIYIRYVNKIVKWILVSSNVG